MKLRSTLISVLALTLSTAAFAADLSIDWQKNLKKQDVANDYFTFKGALGSATKDQFDPKKKVDAVTGASKFGSTEAFNTYRLDAKGKSTMPSSLRNLFLFPVAADSVRTGDGLAVEKAPNGAITIRFVHRGTAYEIVTDGKGQLVLPGSAIKARKVGHTDNAIGSDFSATGKVDRIDWKKVWDSGIADGKDVKSADGKAASKTGKIVSDVAASEIYEWVGTFQFAFDGKVLKLSAALDAKKK